MSTTDFSRMARRSAAAHGTRTRYVIGCRCDACRHANVAAYHARMLRRRAAAAEVAPSGPPGEGIVTRGGRAHRVKTCPGANGARCVRGGAWLRTGGPVCTACIDRATVWNGLVSAAPARAHLLMLRRAGIGRRAVSAASDVPSSLIAAVVAGKRTRVRAATARRILGIDAGARADGARVSAARLNRRLAQMRAAGFTRRELGRLLGCAGLLQLGKGRRARLRTVARVDRLWRRWKRGEIRHEPALVDAAGPYRQLAALHARGVPLRQIRARLGFSVDLRTPPQRMTRPHAAAVRALFAEIARREHDEAVRHVAVARRGGD